LNFSLAAKKSGTFALFALLNCTPVELHEAGLRVVDHWQPRQAKESELGNKTNIALMKRHNWIWILAFSIAFPATRAHADVQLYGDQDVLGTGTYPSDPTAGATEEGLAPGAVTYATLIQPHGFPFTPSPGDYPGTDQIYVGQTQTGAHDGYSTSAGRINGPQVVTLDYSALIPGGNQVDTLTLGIAADDFQFPAFGQPFTASINGVPNAGLTTVLNGLNQGGPVTQFFTIGLDPTLLDPSHVLTLSINEGGDGGDGWAIDYLTVGVTSSPVPEPSATAFLTVGLLALMGARRSVCRRS
jgi:hypothetical protein